MGTIAYDVPSDAVFTLYETLDTTYQAVVVFIDLNSRVLATNGGSSEVGTARGTRTDLNTRISTGINDYGDVRSPYFGRDLLRQSHARLDALDCRSYTAVVTRHSIALAGDSFIDGEGYWDGLFAKYMHGKYGFGGQGWTSVVWFASGSGTYTSGGTQPSSKSGCVISTVNKPTVSGTWTCTARDATSNLPQLAKVVSSTSGDYIDVSFMAGHDACDIYACDTGTGDGVYKYSWDGGTTWSSNITIGALGANIIAKQAATGVPAIAGTLRLQVVSGTVGLLAANFETRLTSGVTVHKLGSSGSTTAQWDTATPNTWGANLAGNLGLQAMFILLGTNDSTGNAITPAQTAANLLTMANGALSAKPGMDMMLLSPYETPATTNTTPVAQLTLAVRNMCIDHLFAFIDLQPLFQKGIGFYGAPAVDTTLYDNNNAEFAGTEPTGIHPNDTVAYAGGAIRAAVRHMIEP
jgi:lysophospholipase L1-like esterase